MGSLHCGTRVGFSSLYVSIVWNITKVNEGVEIDNHKLSYVGLNKRKPLHIFCTIKIICILVRMALK